MLVVSIYKWRKLNPQPLPPSRSKSPNQSYISKLLLEGVEIATFSYLSFQLYH